MNLNNTELKVAAIVLQEGETIDWNDPENGYVKYLNSMGEIVSKTENEDKKGWNVVLRVEKAPQILDKSFGWVDPYEKTPKLGKFVIVKSKGFVHLAKFDPREGWRNDAQEHLFVDSWLEGLDESIFR